MYTIQKEFRFEAGHRLSLAQSKCRNIHGHNYKFTVAIAKDTLIDDMVIDFSILKKIISNWVNKNIDHALILNKEDRSIIQFMEDLGFAIYILSSDPTAENMSKELFEMLNAELQNNGETCKIISLTLWETDSSCATYYK